MTLSVYRWEDVHRYFPQEVIEQYRKKIIEEWKSGKFKDREIWERYGMSENAFYFEKDYSYVISEINSNINLKKFIGLRNVPEIDYFYKYISKLENNQLNTYFRNIFKISSNTHKKGRRYVIIDSTSIPIDINTWRKRYKIGKVKQYKWSHSSSEGFYVGYKVILAIDALTFEVLGFEIFEGSPNDAKLLEKFIEKLCNITILSISILLGAKTYSWGSSVIEILPSFI